MCHPHPQARREDVMGEVRSLCRYKVVDGPCARVRCLETGPHRHVVCVSCGAVDFGNPFHCPECKREFKRRVPKSTFSFPEDES